MTDLRAAEHAHQHWFIEIGPGPKCYLNVMRGPQGYRVRPDKFILR